MDFPVPADHWVKMKENEKIDKYLDLTRELKKTVEYEGESDTNCSWCTRYGPKKLGKKTGRPGNQSKKWDPQTAALLGSARILRRVLKT